MFDISKLFTSPDKYLYMKITASKITQKINLIYPMYFSEGWRKMKQFYKQDASSVASTDHVYKNHLEWLGN